MSWPFSEVIFLVRIAVYLLVHFEKCTFKFK